MIEMEMAMQSTAPRFFMPGISPDRQEDAYAHLAARMNRPVPAMDQRVYSIQFTHGCADWTATVGQPLEGIRRTAKRGNGAMNPREIPTEDPAVVLAILPGEPFVVYWMSVEKKSIWENPFLAGKPTEITFFKA
jgi:hypothetical protein